MVACIEQHITFHDRIEVEQKILIKHLFFISHVCMNNNNTGIEYSMELKLHLLTNKNSSNLFVLNACALDWMLDTV